MSIVARFSTITLLAFTLSAPPYSPLATAQAAPIPPGVPEPGLVIWGTVVNQTNTAQAITITSANWAVTDGTKSATYSATSRPPTRIVNVNGKSYYILQVPFDTRQIGAVTLADPAIVGIQSFELKSATPPTYTFTPTINGALATVRSVDGAPASSGTVPVAGFTSATRGRIMRVDLGIVPLVDDYLAWAIRYFGDPNLPKTGRKEDFDDDGFINEAEFAAGTIPTNSVSRLQILTLTLGPQPLQGTLSWQSVSGTNYVIETATAPEGPWGPLGIPISGVGTTSQTAVPLLAGPTNQFFRIRLGP